MYVGGQLTNLLCLDVHGSRIAGLYSLRNPDKLARLQEALAEA